MRFAMMMTIGVLVGSAQIPCGYEVTAIIQAPARPPFGTRTAFGQFLDLRVDGDNGSPTGDGSGWGLDAYKYLQDALADAADRPPGATVRLLVAATYPSNPYRPDRDAANPNGTEDRSSTFLLDFDNVQLLGGFPPGGGDLADRDPAVNITVLSGEVNVLGACGDPDAGGCLRNNGSPGCNDATCCEIVCAARPQCCTDQWDQACANLADIVCGTCGEPDSGGCFEANDTPGCEDGNCCALVCDMDPICCLDAWDLICANLAMNDCLPPDAPSNAYHVVTVEFVDDSVRIDGLTVADGFADGGAGNDRGAGMFISNASPAVVRVTFTENSAPIQGGGAMYIEGTAHPLVVNCSMTANDGRYGGAIRIPAPASATLVNCLISGNTATRWGGGIFSKSSLPATLDLINCTVTDNTSRFSGGGIYVPGSIEVTITNSILWGNAPNQIHGEATVTYTDVEGEWPGEGNMNLDPWFVDPDNGDYRLSPGSPCLDAANNTAVPKGVVTDLDGNARFIEDPNTPDTGLGDCPVVDMGSYEFQEGTTDCCPGDLDNSGDIGVKDLLILLGAWGPCPPKGDCPADFDNSGAVGVKDLLFLLGAWGPCP